MSTNSPDRRDRDPLRTGIFGVVLIVCVILVAFGYAKLPFFPQGRPYTAYKAVLKRDPTPVPRFYLIEIAP